MTRSLEGLTVLVLDTEAKSGPTIVRALGRAGRQGHRRSLLDQPSPAQRSRYAAVTLSQPHALSDPDGLVDWLRLDHRRALARLCSAADGVHDPRARRRREPISRTGPPWLCPATTPSRSPSTRTSSSSLANELGVGVPRTWRPESLDEAMELADELPYPVYIKATESYDFRTDDPRFARGRFAHDPATFRDAYARLDEISPLPLVQETVPGRRIAVSGVWDEGEARCVFCYEGFRSWPVSGGYSVERLSVPLTEELMSTASRLMRALRWTGVAQVQFLEDRRRRGAQAAGDQRAPLGLSGVRPVLRIADRRRYGRCRSRQAGPETGQSTHYRVGARSHWLEGSAKRLYVATLRRDQVAAEALESPGPLTALGQMLWEMRPTVHQDDFYLDDLRPLAVAAGPHIAQDLTRAGDAGDAGRTGPRGTSGPTSSPCRRPVW